MFKDKFVKIEDILIDTEEMDLYIELTMLKYPVIGKTEAAAITLTKFYEKTLASNNLRDVKKYVKQFSLTHITTADMISKKRRLPFKSFSKYLENAN